LLRLSRVARRLNRCCAGGRHSRLSRGCVTGGRTEDRGGSTSVRAGRTNGVENVSRRLVVGVVLLTVRHMAFLRGSRAAVDTGLNSRRRNGLLDGSRGRDLVGLQSCPFPLRCLVPRGSRSSWEKGREARAPGRSSHRGIDISTTPSFLQPSYLVSDTQEHTMHVLRGPDGGRGGGYGRDAVVHATMGFVGGRQK
jgi:hypothetical protein